MQLFIIAISNKECATGQYPIPYTNLQMYQAQASFAHENSSVLFALTNSIWRQFPIV